ncbi:hypothetical protein [Geomesophilobacter sediminis]|uniref:Cohesin domain-containing protein n=1 Tax=Geomesophilobacter sediminis TaxID=2798584 RepID=A0A8J7J0T0_9BACT|nr:hypothetical protein [Geomesophilobacter sediminis]MBJ6724063.1 hypothetical protein [Geomesophilobacter sediminis]
MLTLSAGTSFAANLWFNKVSGNTYVLQGSGMDGAAGVQLTVSYSKSLGAATVNFTGGVLSGGMTQANTNVIGQISLIGLVTSGTLPGSGALVTIKFAGSEPTSSLNITFKKMIDPNGQDIATTTGGGTTTPSTTTTGDTGGSGDQSPTGTGTTSTVSGGTATTTTGTAVIGGTVTMPGSTTDDSSSRAKEQVAPQPAQPEPQVAAAPSSASREAASSAPESRSMAVEQAGDAAPVVVPSVLERFRTFDGERTPKNLIALFDRKGVANFVQDPPVAIADGKGTVKLTVSKVRGERAPNFAFRAVHYVSLTKVGDGEWQIEVRPDKGATQASVSMLVNGVPQELPLAVAPKARVDLTKPGNVTEADFVQFLKERGTSAAPKYDLNQDGKRDYLDDYIFTANYLVEREKAKEKAPAKSKAEK